MIGRERLVCSCGREIGWMNDAGPHGSVYCDDCHDAEQRAESESVCEECAHPLTKEPDHGQD